MHDFDGFGNGIWLCNVDKFGICAARRQKRIPIKVRIFGADLRQRHLVIIGVGVAQLFLGMKRFCHAFFECIEFICVHRNAKIRHLVRDVFFIFGADFTGFFVVVKIIIARQTDCTLANVIQEVFAVHFVQCNPVAPECRCMMVHFTQKCRQLVAGRNCVDFRQIRLDRRSPVGVQFVRIHRNAVQGADFTPVGLRDFADAFQILVAQNVK